MKKKIDKNNQLNNHQCSNYTIKIKFRRNQKKIQEINDLTDIIKGK